MTKRTSVSTIAIKAKTRRYPLDRSSMAHRLPQQTGFMLVIFFVLAFCLPHIYHRCSVDSVNSSLLSRHLSSAFPVFTLTQLCSTDRVSPTSPSPLSQAQKHLCSTNCSLRKVFSRPSASLFFHAVNILPVSHQVSPIYIRSLSNSLQINFHQLL
jgi:hypothetical protein